MAVRGQIMLTRNIECAAACAACVVASSTASQTADEKPVIVGFDAGNHRSLGFGVTVTSELHKQSNAMRNRCARGFSVNAS